MRTRDSLSPLSDSSFAWASFCGAPPPTTTNNNNDPVNSSHNEQTNNKNINNNNKKKKNGGSQSNGRDRVRKESSERTLPRPRKRLLSSPSSSSSSSAPASCAKPTFPANRKHTSTSIQKTRPPMTGRGDLLSALRGFDKKKLKKENPESGEVGNSRRKENGQDRKGGDKRVQGGLQGELGRALKMRQMMKGGGMPPRGKRVAPPQPSRQQHGRGMKENDV